jgi:UrcA family protein
MIMNTTVKNTLRAASFFLCGALTLGTLQASARAADQGLPSEKVSYADLDLSKPAGAKTLYHRIVAAANRVCSTNVPMYIPTQRGVRECTDRAIDKAVKDVGSPALSALRPAGAIHFASN